MSDKFDREESHVTASHRAWLEGARQHLAAREQPEMMRLKYANLVGVVRGLSSSSLSHKSDRERCNMTVRARGHKTTPGSPEYSPIT
jgi:hypothetical protein